MLPLFLFFFDLLFDQQLPTIRVSKEKEQSAVPEVGSVVKKKQILIYCFDQVA